MSYAATLAERGGMATCGNHLGVYVGTDVRATPRGWVFVQMPTTTERVKEALAVAGSGKGHWPGKENGERPK